MTDHLRRAHTTLGVSRVDGSEVASHFRVQLTFTLEDFYVKRRNAIVEVVQACSPVRVRAFGDELRTIRCCGLVDVLGIGQRSRRERIWIFVGCRGRAHFDGQEHGIDDVDNCRARRNVWNENRRVASDAIKDDTVGEVDANFRSSKCRNLSAVNEVCGGHGSLNHMVRKHVCEEAGINFREAFETECLEQRDEGAVDRREHGDFRGRVGEQSGVETGGKDRIHEDGEIRRLEGGLHDGCRSCGRRRFDGCFIIRWRERFRDEHGANFVDGHDRSGGAIPVRDARGVVVDSIVDIVGDGVVADKDRVTVIEEDEDGFLRVVAAIQKGVEQHTKLPFTVNIRIVFDHVVLQQRVHECLVRIRAIEREVRALDKCRDGIIIWREQSEGPTVCGITVRTRREVAILQQRAQGRELRCRAHICSPITFCCLSSHGR